MATINDGALLVYAENVMEKPLLARGLMAATTSLMASGFTMREAFDGDWACQGGGKITDVEKAQAAALADATEAADRAMGYPVGDVSLSIAEVFLRSEKSIDARGIRHLNPDRGPHFEMKPELAN